MVDTESRGGRGWRIAVAAFVVVLMGMAGAAVVFLGLAADFVRDEVVLRQRGQIASATVLEISRSEQRKNLPAQVVLDYAGPEPAGRVEVRGVPDGVDVGAVVPVLYDPQDPSRARIATLGWPVVDTLLPLLGVVVSALMPVMMLRVWWQGRRRLRAPEGGAGGEPAPPEAQHPQDPAVEGLGSVCPSARTPRVLDERSAAAIQH